MKYFLVLFILILMVTVVACTPSIDDLRSGKDIKIYGHCACITGISVGDVEQTIRNFESAYNIKVERWSIFGHGDMGTGVNIWW